LSESRDDWNRALASEEGRNEGIKTEEGYCLRGSEIVEEPKGTSASAGKIDTKSARCNKGK